jgi:hypothetical protein
MQQIRETPMTETTAASYNNNDANANHHLEFTHTTALSDLLNAHLGL